MVGSKQKRKTWFSISTGMSNDFVGIKVPSNWNPGKSRRAHQKKVSNFRILNKRNRNVTIQHSSKTS